jgi:hypothetical protein
MIQRDDPEARPNVSNTPGAGHFGPRRHVADVAAELFAAPKRHPRQPLGGLESQREHHGASHLVAQGPLIRPGVTRPWERPGHPRRILYLSLGAFALGTLLGLLWWRRRRPRPLRSPDFAI